MGFQTVQVVQQEEGSVRLDFGVMPAALPLVLSRELHTALP